MTKRILITHGRGAETALVARGVQVEVELTDDIQAALQAGIIRAVNPPNPVKAPTAKKAPKPAKGLTGTLGHSETPEGSQQEPDASDEVLDL